MRILASIAIVPALAAALGAQCFQSGGVAAGLVPTGGFYPAADEGLSPPIDMQLGAGGFPMAGVTGPFTHAVVDSNGVVYLTTGGAAVGTVGFGAFSVDDLRGVLGDSPRVFPYWSDLEGTAATWAVNVDTSVAGRFTVSWTDVEEYFSGGPQFSFSASLFSSGVIELGYSVLLAPPSFGFAGVSIGNGVGTGLETSVDLALGADSGALGLIFQEFDGISVPGFSGRRVTLVPNGLGGYLSVAGDCASNVAYGSGCYDIARESFYELHADAAVASAALQGNSLTLTPTPNGYVAVWNAGGATGYVAPVGFTDLPLGDDDQNLLDLTLLGLPSLPIPGGAAAVLYVHDNGFISTGPANDDGAWNDPQFTDYEPTPSFRNAPETAFWSWHDWNPSETGSGPIRWHYNGALTKLYVTWDGVESYPFGTPNPGTMQFQFDLTSGQVDILWLTISTDTSSTFGSGYLVGYSPAGPSADPGSIVLATAPPVVTAPDLPAMALSAAPTPVINPSTLVTYTATNLPEYIPGSGLYISTLFLSVNPNPAGFDLGVIGAPGCNAYILTLDLDLGGQLTFAPTASWSITYDNVNFAPGNAIAAQAISLITPFSLPNGQNAFGMTVSNAVLSTTQLQ